MMPADITTMTKNDRPETESHESFGTITITRSQGNFDNLFGSNIDTNHAVHLTISRAERRHEHAHDWIHGREQLVSVYLSPLQFAEFLTSLGNGEGTPCTLDYVGGEKMERPPETEATARKVVREFVEKTEDISDFAKGANQLVKDILAKGQKMKKGDREELQAIMTKMTRLVSDSAPFLIKQAEEHIGKMVSEAKATITQHANVLGVEAGAGLKSLSMGDTPALEGPVEFEPETPEEFEHAEMQERLGGVEFEPEEDEPHSLECVCLDCQGRPPKFSEVRDQMILPANETERGFEIPDLPGREIDRLDVDEMNADQVAEKILVRLKALERKGVGNGRDGARFFGPNAYAERGKVYVSSISYQGTHKLTLDEAKTYLKKLNAGCEQRSYEALR